MKKSSEKKERALGINLFLKGERCNSPKCVMVRRPYRPGLHGKKRRRAISEYGQQLLEKQRIKASYGLKEAQLVRIVDGVLRRKSGNVGEMIMSALERQIFNVVFRLGFASSRIVARQLTGHGHICVNGKKINTPSYSVKVGDVISVKPASRGLLIFKNLADTIKKQEPPAWLSLDKEKIEGRMKNLPGEIETPIDINLVVDYYSK